MTMTLNQISVMRPIGHTANQLAHTTIYEREFEVTRIIDDLPVKLALQKRTITNPDLSWWTLSWRTRYSPGGSNRRFYMTKDGFWTIPAADALMMIEEMKALGGLDQRFEDHREELPISTLVSSQMSTSDRAQALAKVTGPEEDWGTAPFFVVDTDPHAQWKKVLIVNTDSDVATFRSITVNPDYKPKKVLRKGEGWWLDNSMLDANVQQTRAFYLHLRSYFEGKGVACPSSDY
jgi:hypothetical protein